MEERFEGREADIFNKGLIIGKEQYKQKVSKVVKELIEWTYDCWVPKKADGENCSKKTWMVHVLDKYNKELGL